MTTATRGERPVMCPHGCGRSVLPSRLAAHYLWAAAEHQVAAIVKQSIAEAIAILSEPLVRDWLPLSEQLEALNYDRQSRAA